ncbi:MAG: hypothetical protein DRQ46_01540 [Gammaproteobacteria bacterium]|nr:MAG: hypothetical protein DRQ46_01540 [Gammaproteobacteria bacterium]
MATKAPGIKNFYRGDTRKYLVTIRDKETGDPVSVDGGVLTVTFKASKSDLDANAALQVIVNAVEADPANPTGEIRIVLTSTDTDIEPGNYFYDFQFVSTIDEVTTILPQENQEDKVKILEDVTRTS